MAKIWSRPRGTQLALDCHGTHIALHVLCDKQPVPLQHPMLHSHRAIAEHTLCGQSSSPGAVAQTSHLRPLR